jgi:hypothetical protein
MPSDASYVGKNAPRCVTLFSLTGISMFIILLRPLRVVYGASHRAGQLGESGSPAGIYNHGTTTIALPLLTLHQVVREDAASPQERKSTSQC